MLRSCFPKVKFIMGSADGTIWKFVNEDFLTGYSLIVASVAVGNVAQLTCDLLISSLHMRKIASVYSPALIPVIGYDPYDLESHNPSTSCEVYKSEKKNVVVLQLRAPVVNKYAKEFLQDVVKTFKEKNIMEIIILSSSFAHEKKHILTSPFRYLANDLSLHKNKAKSLNWQEHEISNDDIHIYGGGFASKMYEICKENSMACLLLYKFCSEGDNIPDAYDMLEHLNTVLPLFDKNVDFVSQLIQPASWKLLFGRPPPQEIY